MVTLEDPPLLLGGRNSGSDGVWAAWVSLFVHPELLSHPKSS